MYILADVDQITVPLHYRFTKTNNGKQQKNGLHTKKLQIYRACKNMLCNGIRHSCGVIGYKIAKH